MADAAPETPQDTSDYDLGDTSLGLPQRDPETGRFVKTDPSSEAPPASTTVPVVAEPLPQEAAPASRHPSWLVKQALDFGYEQQDIDATPTHVLSQVVHRQMQTELRHREEVARFHSLDRPAPAPAPKEEPVEDTLGIDEESYDPAFVKLLKEQRREIKDLKSKLTASEQREQARVAKTLEDQIDLAFESLGPDYEKHFGAGPIADLPEAAPERKRRLAVFQIAGVDLKYATLARLKKQLKDAADTLYPAAPEPPADPKKDAGAYAPPSNGKRITTEQWDKSTTALPTQRKGGPEVKGEALAKQNLERRMREAESEQDVEIMNGLPD